MENQFINVSDLASRLARLEGRVESLERSERLQVVFPGTNMEAEHVASNGLLGSVSFSGNVALDGSPLNYQWQRTVHFLCDEAWDRSLNRLAALAHPVRHTILAKLLGQPCTVLELVEQGIVTSTGKAYHHLGEMQSGGWVAKDSDGRYSIPASRIVPLLVLVAAAEEH
ncbi:winged helix-turn-helix transcriptional regulator [Corynebacterium hindlerae]|uniref:Winged helix-turn-helix transcriptional regulator n=1 Tax=Corynebacterium hindlerae TaxID=699041 RepID=A0A7G5FHV0_9CORY|nr:winged helix-turn-helix domain-containing protein [Corynebacterium hindlerae]QMV86191.1 winged helix-turn-helix transcriptional regulator [Corynebacterium hindlerae]